MSVANEAADAIITSAPPRIERLRRHVLEAQERISAGSPEIELQAARSWLKSGNEVSHILRRGRMAGDILRNLTPVIDPDELLVGKKCYRPLEIDEQRELEDWRRLGVPATSKAYGQRAHMAIDYALLLRQGVDGIRQQIHRYRSQLDISRADDLEKDCFYQACLEALDGMVALSGKYADLADQLAATEKDVARKAELIEIARACRKVPEFPADTFAEALQAIHFVTFCMCAGNQMLLFQLGRPDRYLLPYYLRDLAAGRLTPEVAQELIDCLGILLNEYTPRGLAVGLMVGGRDEYGLDITNELSYLFVQSVGHIHLAYPGVGICWTSDTPQPLMELASRLLARGYSHPAIFNDEVITRGLLRLGLPHRDACLYIHSTCVEITPIAQSNVYVASPYFNLIQTLNDILGVPPLESANAPAREPEFSSFDELLTGYRQRLREVIREGIIPQNLYMMSRAQAGGFPLLSCFVNDCLARGKDIDYGGARTNWIETSFVGLANLIDALAAIRQLVFTEKKLSLTRLREALLANFNQYEDVRALLAKTPKYGNDIDCVDELSREITGFLLAECERYRSYWGDAVVPGFFCWVMHEALGRQTAASADGRVAGFPFADGSGPAQGRERQGPTAAVCSTTKWDHAPMIGGIAVNMRFRPAHAPDELAAPLRHVLETFLKLGGFEAQVNVVSVDTLRDAQAHPEQYRDLVVRVAGYSDYFVNLSPAMQAEVIARTELEIG
ncbi:MAG: pyruvate formate lyase family protein [Armatimonadota bacterium]